MNGHTGGGIRVVASEAMELVSKVQGKSDLLVMIYKIVVFLHDKKEGLLQIKVKRWAMGT